MQLSTVVQGGLVKDRKAKTTGCSVPFLVSRNSNKEEEWSCPAPGLSAPQGRSWVAGGVSREHRNVLLANFSGHTLVTPHLSSNSWLRCLHVRMHILASIPTKQTYPLDDLYFKLTQATTSTTSLDLIC